MCVHIYMYIYTRTYIQVSLWRQRLLDQLHSFKNSQTCLFLHTRATERRVRQHFTKSAFHSSETASRATWSQVHSSTHLPPRSTSISGDIAFKLLYRERAAE